MLSLILFCRTIAGQDAFAQESRETPRDFFDCILSNPAALTDDDMEWLRETALANPEYLVRGVDGIGRRPVIFYLCSSPYDSTSPDNKKRIKVLEILLSVGADPNLRYNYTKASFPKTWYPPRSWNRTIKGGTPLHAVSNAEVARLLVEAGADVNATNEDGDTPLDIVHAVGAVAVANYLESKGAKNRVSPTEWPVMYAPGEAPEPTLSLFEALDENDVENVRRIISRDPEQLNQTDEMGNTPLARFLQKSFHVSIPPWGEQIDYVYSRAEVFEFLVRAGADVNVDVHEEGGGKKTLLYGVARMGIPVLVKTLIEHGADPGKLNTPSTREGYRKMGDAAPPIFGAVLSGSAATIQAILDAHPRWDWAEEARRLYDDNDQTLLHAAAMSGNIEFAEKLLDAGADVNARNRFGVTPLMCTGVSVLDHAPMIDLLLREGADTTVKDDRGRSIIAYATDFPSVEKLINAGAVVNWSDPYPMTYAARRGDAKTFDLLVEVAEGLERAPKDQLLIDAIDGGNTEIIRKLIEADVNINRPGDEPPLIHAVKSGWVKPEVVKVLLEAGADPNIKSQRYGTPLIAILAWDDKLEISKMLLEAGADPNVKDSKGKSLTDIIKENDKHYHGGSGDWHSKFLEMIEMKDYGVPTEKTITP